ncbi:hypothetical protein TNIN_479851 [Trichonephila inaurata madagascariensis]|uniref:Secreted protein n=1 Tax=Trichonephila inaurata madagascariensis TaxID=2747483 RepID=A0A8X6Y4X1_9ARAC|nr:hypothetical protein TNIN_479851 [Trichonephila inaurata madagascariensis]
MSSTFPTFASVMAVLVHPALGHVLHLLVSITEWATPSPHHFLRHHTPWPIDFARGGYEFLFTQYSTCPFTSADNRSHFTSL